MNLAKTLKNIVTEASSLNDYLSSRGINPKFVSRDTKISHAKSALFQKWKSDRKMSEETILEASETELLAKYLNSRGINPKFATKDMKIAHSKSGEFMKWKRDHQHFELGEETEITEAKMPRTTALDRWRKAAVEREIKHNNIEKQRQEKLHQDPSKVTIPVANTQKDDLTTAIDRLEKHLNKEDVGISKTKETSFHKKLDTLVHNTFGKRKDELKMKEEVELDEGKWGYPKSMTTIPKFDKDADDYLALHQGAKFARKNKTDRKNFRTAQKAQAHQKLMRGEEVELAEEQLLDEMINEVLGKDATAGDWIHDFIHSDNPKFAGKSKAERKKMALGAYYGKQNEEFEQLDELKKSTVFSWLKQQPVVPVRKPNSDRVSYNQKVKNHSKSWNRALDRLAGYKPTSENTLDSLAATEAPCDNSDMTNGTSKAATMVKNLKKKIKEETYDWEKDDKSSMQKPYGKAPKINVTDKKGTLGDTKPEARAVMKGGTTLTGQPRDMVEIDPSMKQRPGQDKGQSTFTSPIAKKSP